MTKNKIVQKKSRLKIGEKVKIISGKERGKVGLIKKIIKPQNKIIVQGINIKIKHVKASGPEEKGEIKRIEFPIDSSNVSPYEE
uniref:50S ribosomal protein L24 n=1 Tax=Analipus japonicus TaxID=31333 RepID=UPI002E77248E|nr:50S ribosomal protein L24 [Analipus japonicus]WAM61884.1 50S ribosomal protein L24 [Analipus japonicus]